MRGMRVSTCKRALRVRARVACMSVGMYRAPAVRWSLRRKIRNMAACAVYTRVPACINTCVCVCVHACATHLLCAGLSAWR
jgi:hypothetical protein